MGIFSPSGGADRQSHQRKTIIASGSRFSGDLALDHDLLIEGQFEGKLTALADIAIGKKGKVKGELKAKTLLVSGHFEGQLQVTRLEILADGVVRGDIYADTLMIEPGATFIGTSHEVDKPAVAGLSKTLEPEVAQGVFAETQMSALNHEKTSKK